MKTELSPISASKHGRKSIKAADYRCWKADSTGSFCFVTNGKKTAMAGAQRRISRPSDNVGVGRQPVSVAGVKGGGHTKSDGWLCDHNWSSDTIMRYVIAGKGGLRSTGISLPPHSAPEKRRRGLVTSCYSRRNLKAGQEPNTTVTSEQCREGWMPIESQCQQP